MAQNARISALSDELIHSVLEFDPATNRQAYKHAKEIAARGLRGHQYARTNQFDVQAKYAGLDEKFRVKNRDDLADALLLRLQKLEALTHKFKPDLLSLLLELSDRPLENSKVEALELLRPPVPPPALTWDQMLEEDPYSDEEIWKDIDYAVDSSGDEQVPKKQGKTKPSPPTSVDEGDTHNPESCIVSAEILRLEDVEMAQFWKTIREDPDTKTEVPELLAVRETMFMLAGLQTSLFQIDTQQNNIRLSSSYTISHAIAGTIDHLLSQFATIGRDVYRLRQWSKRSSSLPLIHTFEAAVTKRLAGYDLHLSQLQKRYLVPETPIPVSLLEFHHEIRTYAAPLLRLAHIVTELEPQLLVNPFSHLEELYSQTTLAQMTLDKQNFDFFSGLFFDCIQTYLRPIRRWMEAGELGSNDETFFIFESDSESEIASLWHDRFVLRRSGQNKLRSPSFLQPAAQRIFNTGKSVVFLKELDIYKTDTIRGSPEPRLDHQTVCGTSEDVPLSPFPELFQAAFDTWMRSTYSQASATLREHLFKTSGLMHILTAFQTLYLGKNGAVLEEFASAIFDRMDTGNRGWNDRYMLTDLARGVFGMVLRPSDIDRVVVRSGKTGSPRQSIKGLAAVMIDYALPWSAQNILQRSSLPIYQQIFTFLLQTYRVKFLLQRIQLSRSVEDRPLVLLIYRVKHRLIWLADTLRSYLTETVVAFTTHDMETSMEKAEDIDEMAQIHVKFVAKLQERAMLSSELKPIHKAFVEILDLGVLFTTTVAYEQHSSSILRDPNSGRTRSKASGRMITSDLSGEEDEDSNEGKAAQLQDQLHRSNRREALQRVDREFLRLLSFLIAGLRSVGRVGAEPMWEQLAERLEWEGKKDRV